MIGPDIDARAEQITDDFHRLYYDGFETTWEQTFWKGVKILKCPLDLWVYQEILWETQPDLVFETGTAHGGSALWFADMLESIGNGQVISVDIAGRGIFPNRPDHDRLTYLQHSSTAPDLHRRIMDEWADKNVLVVLDSDHSQRHVAAELRLWSDLVQPGGYLIVEDTNVHGHPISPEHPAGPWEAVEEFLGSDNRFEQDRTREKFRLTFNPGGYLRRLR